MRPRTTILLIAVCSLAAWFILRDNEPAPTPQADESSTQASIPQSAAPSTQHPRQTGLESPTRKPIKRIRIDPERSVTYRHSVSDLDAFILPPIEFHDETLAQSLDKIFYQYQKICLHSGEVPLPLSYQIDGRPLGRMSLTLEGSLPRVIERLAVQLGMAAYWSGNQVTLTAIPYSHEYKSVGYTVPTNFPKSTGVPLEQWGELQADAFQNALQNHYKHHLHLSPDSQVLYNPDTQQLTLLASHSDHQRFERLNALLHSTEPVQQLTQLRRITVTSHDDPISKHMQRSHKLPPAELQLLLRELASREDTSILTLPSLVSVQRDPAEIALVQANASDAESWSGMKCRIESQAYGFALKHQIDWQQQPHESDTHEHPVHHADHTAQTFYNYSSNTSIISLFEIDDQAHYLLVTTQLVDASGKPTALNNPRR